MLQCVYQEPQWLTEKNPSGSSEGALRDAESVRVKAAVMRNGNTSIADINGNGDWDTPGAEMFIG